MPRGRPKMDRTHRDLERTFPVTLPPDQRLMGKTGGFGKLEEPQRRAMVTRHRRSKLKESADAKEKNYKLDGKPADRYEVMEYLVALVSEGMTLVDLCKEDGMPTLLEVRHWRKWHEAFDKELKEADACRGERLGEEAITQAMDATDDQNAAMVKLKTETLSKAAARLNADFVEKKLVQTEDLTERQTEAQLIQRYQALVKQFPALKELSDSTGITEAEIVQDEEVTDEDA